jgi:methionyl-tRNA formyltransferase
MTGVTLQTLDDKSFDHGIILAQTPQNGLLLPGGYNCTYPELLDFITPKAAELLVQGIRDKVYVPPLVNAGWYSSKTLLPAPKITVDDRQIDWQDSECAKIDRQHRALGRLWNHISVDTKTEKRFIFEDIEIVPLPKALAPERLEQIMKGYNSLESLPEEEVHFMVYRRKDTKAAVLYVRENGSIILKGRSKDAIRVKTITVEGQGKQAAGLVMENIDDREIWKVNGLGKKNKASL